MSAEHADRLSALDKQRFIVTEAFELGDDRVEAFPVSRRLARPAVNHKLRGIFGDVRIEIVHQHPQRRFLLPTLAGKFFPARSAHDGRG